MSKFTKGPWRIEYSKCYSIESASVFNAHGFMCSANVIKVDEERMEGESWLDMRDRTEKARKEVQLESVANMQLISAAPDMFEAIADVLDSVFERDSSGNLIITITQECSDKLVAAIQKAEGKKS